MADSTAAVTSGEPTIVKAEAEAEAVAASTAAAAAAAAAAVVPPAPVKGPAAAVPPGELYKFKAWQTALIFLIALLLDLPFWIDRLGGRIYPVHKAGVVLVTGASTGIGKDAAVALAKREPKMVVFAGVRSRDAAKGIENLKIGNLKAVTLDVTSDGSVNGAYKAVTKEMEKRGLPFVGLVGNAGVSANAPVEFHAIKDAQALFDVNYFGLMRVTQKFLPLLRQSKGRIINVSSILGALTVQELGVYSASKHAMESTSDALRRELRPLDVSVSIVQPGFVQSPIHQKVADTRGKLPAEAQQVYAHLYSKARDAMKATHLAKASSTACTSNAIHHALTSPTPKTRYPVANSGGVPAPLVTLSSYLFPDRLTDYLLTV